MARLTEHEIYDRVHEVYLAAESAPDGPDEAELAQVVAEALDDAVEATVAAQDRVEEVLGLVVALKAAHEHLTALRGRPDDTNEEIAA